MMKWSVRNLKSSRGEYNQRGVSRRMLARCVSSLRAQFLPFCALMFARVIALTCAASECKSRAKHIYIVYSGIRV